MSDPTGDMLLRLRIEREGAEVLPQTAAQVVRFNDVLRSTTGSLTTTTTQMFRMSAGQQRVGVVAQGSSRGIGMMRNALIGLGFQATGTAGPIGRLASGLLLFGGGSALVLGVAAGIGVIATAYQLLTKDAREAAAEHRKLMETLTQGAATRAAALTPESAKIERDVEQATRELAALTVQRRARLAALAQIFGQGKGEERGFATFEAFLQADSKLRQIDEDRAALSVTIAQNRRAAVPAAKEEADQVERALRAERERVLLIRQGALERDISLGRLRTIVPLIGGGAGVPKLEGGMGPAFKPEKFAPRELFLQDLVKEGGKAADVVGNRVPEAFQRMATAAITGSETMTSAVIGSFADILANLPGVSDLAGGLIGLAGGFLSSLLGGGSRGVTIDRYGPDAIQQLRGIPSGPERIELLIQSPTTGEIVDRVIYTLGSRTRTDAVPRVPGLILAGG